MSRRASCVHDAAESAIVARLTDLSAINAGAHAAASSFIESTIGGHEDRAVLGGRALLYLRRQRNLHPPTGEDAVGEVRSMLTFAAMCGWRRAALAYAQQLTALPACISDTGCYCEALGRLVNLLRSEENASAAAAYYSSARGSCPFASSWQMPAPATGFVPGLRASPFWEPREFATARMLHAHRAALLRELRPFARQRTAEHWSRDRDRVAYELIEAGRWRQLTLYQTAGEERAWDEPRAWDESLCRKLPRTCTLLREFARTTEGRRELGGKVKLFELGPGARLMPHFGMTNRRLFVHMAVLLPGQGAARLTVADEERSWAAPGELLVFDDSFEHLVHNEASAGVRVVLGVEVNHPDVVQEG